MQYKVLGLFTCYNRCEKTRRCLESLSQDIGVNWKFIAVNDNSTDGTEEFLKNKKEVMMLQGNGNLYYSGGMRLAIKNAKEELSKNKYDFVLFMNDDVDFYCDAVSRLIAYLGDEQAIMVGATENKNGEYTYGGVVKKSNWRPKYEYAMSKGSKVRCDTFNANCVLIPSKIFLALDNIDPSYVHAFGDYDYGFAASKRGIKIYVSNFFVGICENDHPKKNTWLDPELPRKKRLELKETALGNPRRIWFYFLKKNYSLVCAILYTVNDYMKIILKR